MSKVLSSIVIAASLLFVGCAGITVHTSKLSFSEVCTAERTRCAADGEYAVNLPKDRPAFQGNDPSQYLGKLVKTKNVRAVSEPCVTPTSEDYATSFTNILKVSLLKEEDIQARIKAAVDASLPSSVRNRPGVKAALEASVRHALAENAVTNATYKVYRLKDTFINKISTATEGSFFECKRLLQSKAPDYSFVMSVAVITADGKIKSVQEDNIKVAITSALNNLQLREAGITASAEAELAVSIVRNVSTTIESEMLSNSSIYSYGMWNHGLQAAGAAALKSVVDTATTDSQSTINRHLR